MLESEVWGDLGYRKQLFGINDNPVRIVDFANPDDVRRVFDLLSCDPIGKPFRHKAGLLLQKTFERWDKEPRPLGRPVFVETFYLKLLNARL